uniref:50S ribosomal protein L21, chloroplastic n=1 Tax=Dasya binghamiae TaxID=1896963 RepID=A0A1C8XRV5_9FLOR|nr:ribosomal protein L21 [Dasya binghamiae]AOH77214.1 ribosomal protein L21 [Dasya binghamiae]
MINYAIVEAGGKQLWVETGKFYDLNYIPGNPGDLIYLNRVLFIYKNNLFKIGMPCLKSSCVKTKILKHIRGRKLIVFKIKPKKNDRCKKGHRQQLTRLLVEEII